MIPIDFHVNKFLNILHLERLVFFNSLYQLLCTTNQAYTKMRERESVCVCVCVCVCDRHAGRQTDTHTQTDKNLSTGFQERKKKEGERASDNFRKKG